MSQIDRAFSRRFAYTSRMAKKALPTDEFPRHPPPFMLANDKRSLILRAAFTLFLRDGFSNTSMDAVTAGAGVSKATVYAHFPSKAELFEVVMREGAAAAFQEFPPLVRAGGSPEAELLAFFEPVLFMILMRGGQAWARLVIAEAVRHPENAALFHECAVSRIADLVEGYLRSLSKEGLIPGKELRLCAENLISVAMMGPLNRGLLLGPKAPDYLPGIRHGVRMFLRGLMAKG